MTDCRVKDAINSHVIPAPSLQKPFSSSAFLLVRWGNTVCSLTWLPPATLWLRCSNWKITSDLICVSGCDKLAVLSFWAQWYLLASSSKQLFKKKKKKRHTALHFTELQTSSRKEIKYDWFVH